MKSPTSIESPEAQFTHSRNPRILNNFPIPKNAHTRNSRKKNTLAHSSQKHGGYGDLLPKLGNEKNYFDGAGVGTASFAPSRSTNTWFNFALNWPRSCAFVM
jgi:hypothetical protein